MKLQAVKNSLFSYFILNILLHFPNKLCNSKSSLIFMKLYNMQSEDGISSKRSLLGYRSQVCRGCLKFEEKMENLFENKCSQDFYKFTGIEISKFDGISEVLCHDCHNTLRLCKRFRIQCQKSDIILKDLQAKDDKICPSKQPQSKPVETCTVYEVQKNGSLKRTEPTKHNIIYMMAQSGKLILRVIPEITELNANGDCRMVCPKCRSVFKKINLLVKHIANNHENIVNFDFKDVVTEFYCPSECSYNINSGKNKCFTRRSLLRQHVLKVHSLKQFKCSQCEEMFSTKAAAQRHENNCNNVYECNVCTSKYKTSESLLVHLFRKHPDAHKEYKQGNKSMKKEIKRNCTVSSTDECVENYGSEEESDYFIVKKMRFDNDNLNLTDKFTQTSIKVAQVKNNEKNTVETQTFVNRNVNPKIQQDFSFDFSPRRTFATQTLFSPFQSKYSDVHDCVKNDITLGSWISTYKPASNRTNIESPGVDLLTNDRTNSFVNIETQTALDELLYSKPQNSNEDSLLFSDLICLSDIQTQTTWPTDFSMDNSIKQTIETQTSDLESTYLKTFSSQTCLNSMSPDLSYKETQTHFSFLDSPNPSVSGFNFPKSLFESANSSPISSYASIETQTPSRKVDRNDVLLSFNTMETQTYFENRNSDHAIENL